MSATKESVDKAKAACQSPNGSPLHKGLEPDDRPLSPLTIGSINTVTWKYAPAAPKKPPADLPQIRLKFVLNESDAPLLFMRKLNAQPDPPAVPPEGYSYNCMNDEKFKNKVNK